MDVTPAVRAMILEQASAGQIRRVAVGEGMLSLREDGWRLVREGRTTLEEVLRVTKEERLVAGSGDSGSELEAPTEREAAGAPPKGSED